MESEAQTLDRDPSNCSIGRTLEVIGEKWTILILRDIWYGAHRFSDLERVLGCPRNLLSERLKKLVENGILATELYQEEGSRSRHRYVITQKGVDLVPAVLGLLQWGDRFRADAEGPAVLVSHKDCGAPLHVEVRCEAGHQVSPKEVEMAPGPSFRLKLAR